MESKLCQQKWANKPPPPLHLCILPNPPLLQKANTVLQMKQNIFCWSPKKHFWFSMLLKLDYLHSPLCRSRCFRERCRNLFTAVLPHPYQTKPYLFGLNLESEKISKEAYANYPHGLHTAASRDPRRLPVLETSFSKPILSLQPCTLRYATL